VRSQPDGPASLRSGQAGRPPARHELRPQRKSDAGRSRPHSYSIVKQQTQLRIPAARTRPSYCLGSPSKSGGRRESRVLAAPIASHAHKKRTSVVATGSAKQSDLPCAMVYGLFRALLGDRAFLPPSLADRSANLTPASGRQDHTALPSAINIVRLATPKRPPHPAPNVRDDREAPLLWEQDAVTVRLIWGLRQCHAHATD